MKYWIRGIPQLHLIVARFWDIKTGQSKNSKFAYAILPLVCTIQAVFHYIVQQGSNSIKDCDRDMYNGEPTIYPAGRDLLYRIWDTSLVIVKTSQLY